VFSPLYFEHAELIFSVSFLLAHRVFAFCDSSSSVFVLGVQKRRTRSDGPTGCSRFAIREYLYIFLCYIKL
jgi:hypothetical protein